MSNEFVKVKTSTDAWQTAKELWSMAQIFCGIFLSWRTDAKTKYSVMNLQWVW